MSEKSRGGLGCIGTVLTVIVLWALLFGVTIGGRHYGISCSATRGVEFHSGTLLPSPDAPEPK